MIHLRNRCLSILPILFMTYPVFWSILIDTANTLHNLKLYYTKSKQFAIIFPIFF